MFSWVKTSYGANVSSQLQEILKALLRTKLLYCHCFSLPRKTWTSRNCIRCNHSHCALVYDANFYIFKQLYRRMNRRIKQRRHAMEECPLHQPEAYLCWTKWLPIPSSDCITPKYHFYLFKISFVIKRRKMTELNWHNYPIGRIYPK